MGAIDGVRIIDLTRVLGGPYCTQALADHGADIIKLEPPQGDETRGWGPPFDAGLSAYFAGANRNKRSIIVDLNQDDGKDLLLELLQDADVLIHNLKAGTLEKWGLGYDAVLQPRFPKLIYCHITGFGETGPLGALPGYDAVVQAMSGMMSINGTPESGPVRVGTPMVDLGTGLYAAIAIMMALYERDRSHKGQKIDVSLYDCAIALLHPHGPNALMSGKTPTPTGNAHPNISPYDTYKTGTVPIFLAVGNDRQFQKLCDLLDAPEIGANPDYATNADRLANRDDLKIALEAKLAPLDGHQSATKLLHSGVPAGAVSNIKEVIEAAHTAHRDMIIEIGRYKGLGVPAKLSRTPGNPKLPPPGLGQHTIDICREIGLDDGQIQALIDRGVVKAGS